MVCSLSLPPTYRYNPIYRFGLTSDQNHICISEYTDLKFASSRYNALRHRATAMSIDLDEIIKALAHPVRRDILTWLKDPKVQFPEQLHNHEYGICAGQIDQRCGLSQSTVSAHLATLQRAGLISSQKAGQWHFFKRNEETIQAFLTALFTELSSEIRAPL